MPAAQRDLSQAFLDFEELMPAGFSAAGRSSANPATASKAEKKKRGEGARRSTVATVSGKDRCDLVCVRPGHGQSLYTA
jgi:hypothetical protein